MNSIVTEHSAIHFNEAGYEALNALLIEKNYSKIFVLVDENTNEHCFADFSSMLHEGVVIDNILEIESGEEHKTIDTCVGIWEALSQQGADRKSLLINLGGGVITDLGGFVAAAFKRGIDFVNVPTSLLAMVDASVGGKTGVDLGVIKNQVGVVKLGEMVVIDTHYLGTLPEAHIRSGLAEMFKHGLIADADYFEKMASIEDDEQTNMDALIYESVMIKHKVVTEDPEEQGLRKILNYGHTLGHAIESYFLDHPGRATLLHGEAIAIGMIMETFLSHKLLGFPEDEMEAIKSTLLAVYGSVDITDADREAIIDLLKYDKKNSHGNINFVLLERMGVPKIDVQVENVLLHLAFDYYRS